MQTIKFLIIDDDSIDRACYLRILKNSLTIPYEVMEAATGREALAILEEQSADCIFLDYQLPDTDGVELLPKVKKIVGRFVPIIMLTGQNVADVAVSAMKAGAIDYVIKNKIDPALLTKTVMSAIRHAQLKKIIHQQKKQLKMYAYYDELTGLVNRHTFEEMAERALQDARQFKHSLAILILDLDNFMSINESLGHLAGDDVLIAVAQRLTYILPKEAIIARLGDDEFAVLLVSANVEVYAATAAKKIIESLSEPYPLSVDTAFVGVSIGIFCYSGSGNHLSDVLKNAHTALSCAKKLGRGNFQFYSEAQNKDYQKNIELEKSLHNAVTTNHEFKLVYQPCFALNTQTIVGIEILLRWQHAKLGVLNAEQVMPMVEKTGLIIPVGKWMLETTLRQLTQISVKTAKDFPFTLAVNFLPRQLSNELIAGVVNELGKDQQFKVIQLALSETAILEYLQKETLLKSSGLSLQLVISDFAMGVTMFEKILSLPVSSIKIARSVLRGVRDNKLHSVMIKSLITMGKELGLKVIVDGVDTEDDLKLLQSLGCEFGQGDFLCEPMEIETLKEYLV